MDCAKYPVSATRIRLLTMQIGCAVGATGAVGTLTGGEEFKASAPIVRNGVGDYTVKLRVPAAAYFHAFGQAIGAVDATKGEMCKVIAYDITGSTPYVRFQFVNGAGAAAEVANGDNVRFTIIVQV